MATSGNEWKQMVQPMTANGTTNDNEWQRMTANVNRVTTSETSGNEWQRVTTNYNEW